MIFAIFCSIMTKFQQIFYNSINCRRLVPLCLGPLFLCSCISSYEPVERFEENEEKRREKIENRLVKRHSDSTYQSLAFGQLIVYKPESFKALDSLYALKDEYIERNDLRGLEKAGIEDMIPAYRAEAQEDIDEVRYEIEHVYSIKKNDSLTVQHAIFLFNHQDSITSEDQLYKYTIPQGLKEMHTNYLFEYHFITNRDLYISRDERDFIRYFKSKEQQLAGTKSLQPFMVNLLNTMQLAQRINSVDYRDLVKFKSIQKLKDLNTNLTIIEFGTLLALKDKNDQIIGYEFSIRWQRDDDKIKKKTIFSYSPTLNLIETQTTKE